MKDKNPVLLSREEYTRLQSRPPSWLWAIVGTSIGINAITCILLVSVLYRVENFMTWLWEAFNG